MKHLEDKIDSLQEDMTDVRISMAKQEENLKNQSETLSTLTDSVVYHVARTNALEALVLQNQEMIERDKAFLKGALWVIAGIISLILAVAGIVTNLH